MPSVWLDKCCLCIPLRVGTFIIGYLLTVIHTLLVVVTTINLVYLMQYVISDSAIKSAAMLTMIITQYCILSLFVLRLIFSIVLVVGLHKRKWSLVRIFYIAYSVLMVLYLILLVTNLAMYARYYRAKQWLIMLPDLILTIFSIYSIFVTSRFYKLMKNQSNITPRVTYNAEKRENVA